MSEYLWINQLSKMSAFRDTCVNVVWGEVDCFHSQTSKASRWSVQQRYLMWMWMWSNAEIDIINWYSGYAWVRLLSLILQNVFNTVEGARDVQNALLRRQFEEGILQVPRAMSIMIQDVQHDSWVNGNNICKRYLSLNNLLLLIHRNCHPKPMPYQFQCPWEPSCHGHKPDIFPPSQSHRPWKRVQVEVISRTRQTIPDSTKPLISPWLA